MRRQLLRAIAPIGVVVSAHLAISPAVDAVAWGPVTSTYKSEIRVEGKGSHFNDRGINAANQMTIKDRSKDKNTVYGKTTFKYNDLDVYGRPTWKTVAVKSTGEWENTTKTVTVSVKLDSQRDRSRATSEACAQMGWPVPDSCEDATTTFSY